MLPPNTTLRVVLNVLMKAYITILVIKMIFLDLFFYLQAYPIIPEHILQILSFLLPFPCLQSYWTCNTAGKTRQAHFNRNLAEDQDLKFYGGIRSISQRTF